ncbi:hypothetical protein AB3N60_15520 [Leptospira sp. WS39.C2]
MIAGRDKEKVNPNFAEFYVQQVLAGNIKKDIYGGKTVGIFFNSSKPYLEPITSLADTIKLDLYSEEGKKEAVNILNHTDAQVAQVYLDYDGDGEGNHFVIAYKDPNGDWKIKDHNYEKGSQVGEDLLDALSKNKIKDIRLVHPEK